MSSRDLLGIYPSSLSNTMKPTFAFCSRERIQFFTEPQFCHHLHPLIFCHQSHHSCNCSPILVNASSSRLKVSSSACFAKRIKSACASSTCFWVTADR